MIVLIAVVAGVAWAAIQIGIPWPIAVVAGFAAPLAASTLYLRSTGRDAPTSRLSPDDPRSRRFLLRLAESYRSLGYLEGVKRAEDVLRAYDAAEHDTANRLFRSFSNLVANSQGSTMLISAWQNAWRDSAS